MPPACHISQGDTFVLQLIVASVLAAIAFRLDNQGVLTGAMLVSPIGGVVLQTALGHVGNATPLTKLYIPIVVGVLAGVIPGARETATLANSGINVLKNATTLLDSAFVAMTCGILFPVMKRLPEVGVDIATQLLPPIVAIGFALALAVRKKLPWQSMYGCLLLFVTYAVTLFVSARITQWWICKRGMSD